MNDPTTDAERLAEIPLDGSDEAFLAAVRRHHESGGIWYPKGTLARILSLIDQANRGCPCLYVEPCDPQCSCAHPFMSAGCRRCCRYGSLEQRTAAAKGLAQAREDMALVDWLEATPAMVLRGLNKDGSRKEVVVIAPYRYEAPTLREAVRKAREGK